ncbi:hypothetical protein KP004_08980 [Geomonas oryzisoli]|uniref:Uncharacterized protein n=1 Tax=Geomonas oryzisoli TaxID=2847992 RepID=A0ABX8JDP7_9BACT|nr:hypothetical protein [Geomonas oryzisoli]QWV95287.1 hypothetical protein KP004_08980 [Geomonas oryzisoli]
MKLVVRLMMVLLFACTVTLYGCGGGGGDEESIDGLLRGVGWLYDNAPADLSSHDIGLGVWLYYDQTLATSDIQGFTVTAPDGGHWTVTATSNLFGTTRNGPYVTGRLVNSNTPSRLPLAGTWTFTLRLKNGTISSIQKKFHEPGSSADATHPYVYVKEDWTPNSNTSQYVAALGRFSAYNYALQYSAGVGSITSTGLANIRSMYFNAEPTAYNMYCWLYDANRVYLGYTITEYSASDHSSTGLVTPGGELAISAAATTGASGPVDLSLVKYIRFVYVDGAQFSPGYGYDYRSVSYLVPVN